MRFPSLKPGDVVLVENTIQYGSSWGRKTITVYLEQTVTKVTERQLTVSTGKRFMLESGREVGGKRSVYPVGFKSGRYSAMPAILTATPEDEILRINDAIRLASRMSSAVFKLNKDNGEFYRAVKEGAVFEALQELETAFRRFFEKIGQTADSKGAV